MGLLRWLAVRVASAFGQLPHQRVRRYKVTLLGEPVGIFTLPIGDHMQNPNALLRPILTPPFRCDFGEQSYYDWVEAYPNRGFKTVEYHPLTPQLHDEAMRFYTTANGVSADGSHDANRQLPLPARTTEETRLIRAILDHRDSDQPYRDYAAWRAVRPVRERSPRRRTSGASNSSGSAKASAPPGARRSSWGSRTAW